MQSMANEAVYRKTPTWAFERTGQECRRCGAKIQARGQGEDNRLTYWCTECQR
jgi:endonuclease-8